ncbi:MAG: beta-lactamase regulating signal transducer with metallopeptidase domain [Planctomycetaceae bacterium]|jgi:beta-lactamase regulating signal transducer with metallopeptidase domain
MSNLTMMQDGLPLADSIVGTVLFHSLLIVIGVSTVALLLRSLPIRSAPTNQLLWMLVLLSGVAIFQIPIEFAILSAESAGSDRSGRILPPEHEWQRPGIVTPDLATSSGDARSGDLELTRLDFPRDSVTGDAVRAAAADKIKDSNDLVVRRKTVAERSSGSVLTNSPGNSDDGFGVVSSNAGQRSSTAVGFSKSRPKAAEPSGHSSVVGTKNANLKNVLAEAAFSAWAAGGFVVVFLSAWRLWNFRRVVRREVVSPAESCKAQWEKEWSAVCSDANIRRVPRLCFTESVGPGICPGLTRPSLVIPVSLWQKLDDSQRLTVLRHEAAHLTRRDLWRSLLVRLLALPHWFNPCAWLAVRRFDEAGEWACDERAVPSNSDDGCRFAELLVELAASGSRRAVFAGQPLVAKNSLKERVTRLVRSENQSERAFWRTAIVLMIPCLLLTSALFEIRLVAQSPDSPHEPVSVSRDRPVETPKTEKAATQSVSNTATPAGAEQAADATPQETPDSQPVKVVNPRVTSIRELRLDQTPDRLMLLSGFQFTP